MEEKERVLMNNKDNKIIKVLSVEDNPELANLMQDVLPKTRPTLLNWSVVTLSRKG
jgi:hypothetical protein